MKFAETDSLKEILRFAPDPRAQTESGRLVLTVLDILQIVGEGTIGPDAERGEEARKIKRPLRKTAKDAVGNWDLVQGTYWVTYSEKVGIPGEAALILQPHEMLMKNGLWHPTLVIRDWEEFDGVLLAVSARGVRIMEGAPISTGFIVE